MNPNNFISIILFISYLISLVISNPVLANNTNTAKLAKTNAIQIKNQTIRFGNPPVIAVGGKGEVSADSSAGLSVSLSSTTTNVCTINGVTVTAIAAGTCSIAANQTGNTQYSPAVQAILSFTINKANQTISFQKIPPIAVGGSGSVSATASSGLAVSFSSATPSTCTTNENVISGIAAGTCLINANQNGDANYNAAKTNEQKVIIAKGQQSISFAPTPNVAEGQTGQLSATSSSGLAVTFSTLTPKVCSLYSNTVFGISTGTCKIEAEQPGDANFAAAPHLVQSVTILKPQTGNTTNGAVNQTTQSSSVATGNSTQSGTNSSSIFPCESLGFSTSASAAANQTALQTCISNYSNVSVTTPGNYQVAGTVVLPSDISLQIGAGVNLYRAVASDGGTHKFFVNQNYGSTVYPVKSVSSSALGSSGSGLDFLYNVTVTLPSLPAISVGQYVLFKGDTTNLYNGIRKVTAVNTTANTVSFQMAYTPGGMPQPVTEPNPNSVSGIGMTLALADANITLDIKGAIWGQFSAGLFPVSDSPDAHLLVFNKIHNLNILNFTGGDTFKYVINASNVYNSTLTNINLLNRSDGLHFQTPLNNVTINGVTGDTADSTIAFTPKDYVQYYNPDSQNGDMNGINISNVHMTNSGNVVGLYPNGIYNISNVVIDDIDAVVAVGAMVQVIGEPDDTNHTVGTVASGSNVITNLVSTLPWYGSNLSGFYVTGNGIPDGTYIVSQNPATNTAVLSQAATGSYAAEALDIVSNGMQNDVTITNVTPPQNSGILSTVNVTLNTLTLSGINSPDVANAIDDVLTITSTTNTGANASARYWTNSTTSNIYMGQPVSGVNVPAGTYVTFVGSNYVDLSAAPTGSVSEIRVKRITGIGTTMVQAAQYSTIGTVNLQNSNFYVDFVDHDFTGGVTLFQPTGVNGGIGELNVTNSTVNFIGTSGDSVIARNLTNLNISDSQINGYGAILEGASSSSPTNPPVVNINNVNVSRLYEGIGAVQTGTVINVSNLTIQPIDERGLWYENGILNYPFFNFWNSGVTVNMKLHNITTLPLNQFSILYGNSYVIDSVDNANPMTAYGAASNTVGLGFTATGYGTTGVGTVEPSLFTYTAGNTLNLIGSADGSISLDGTKFNFSRGDLFWNTNPAFSLGLGTYITGVTTVKID